MGPRTDFDPLTLFHRAVRTWFASTFDRPTRPQALGWPSIARGDSTLILAPTGSGKTLAAFLWCLDRIMFAPIPPKARRCRIVYVSPLKALAVDVERNLRAPLAGIVRAANDVGEPCVAPSIAIRTGDTPPAERTRFRRDPADILITTPESLYLLLTSNARDLFHGIDTIIIDEIHALVPTKRGAHLAVSLERLTARCDRAPQRIGLSATQRPLDEVARFLGGVHLPAAGGDRRRPPRRGRAEELGRAAHALGQSGQGMGDGARDEARASGHVKGSSDLERAVAAEFGSHAAAGRYRPVTVVDAGTKKAMRLAIEVPVEDMARLTVPADRGTRPASGTHPSIWAAIYPRLLELIRSHRSTLIFVNSRRLAERMAAALNELAGDTLVRSHHGSLARSQRVEVEDLLKVGALRALVATSSLELGIDMGAIDLVVQIEAPPSVASGLQRIGRAGHSIGEVSEGVIFPKFRGDLVASAAIAKAMHDGAVEATRYPRNPLDIAAQQVVAMASMDEWNVDTLFAVIRCAAPFAQLSRAAFDSVLDMLAGRYPSDEFAELRPRITWDRVAGTLTAREGARRVAIVNGGTIPDRGLYGVFLTGAAPGAARVGELDEEMVFESRVGETFVLGASSWRIDAITHDRVLVSPAPGEPGKTPFWKGDRAGRPLELGLAIGRLMRDLLKMPVAAAIDRLTGEHDLERGAAEQLLQYLHDQVAAVHAVPDATTLIIERVRDEQGDWRVCVLSPRGGRVHAPWAMAAVARIREETGIDTETLWGDDGFVVRFPDVDRPPDHRLLLPDPDDVQGLVIRQLGATALFAAKFRENAARSLLLPKRRPGMRVPLWQQRKRSADLLAVAARYGSFPILLETYRECLRDFFDVPALRATLADVRSRTIRVVTVDSDKPSPFAASLLFSYVASFLYDGDAPLAERRAQALSIDHAQLRELIGDAELRELLDTESMHLVERRLQRLEPSYRARSLDGLHDLLLSIGDLSANELRERTSSAEGASSIETLLRSRRAVAIDIAGQRRYIAVEDSARYRDAIGVALPRGIPQAFLAPVDDPTGDLARRYARTHAPFTSLQLAARYGLSHEAVEVILERLATTGRLLEGEFRPGCTGREWTDADVLGQIRRRSLAKLRREVEPVEQNALGRFSARWHGAIDRRHGADALLDVIEQLQGAPLSASIVETEILSARLDNYDPADLDAVMAAGEVVWVGVEPVGDRDGRIALYLSESLERLLPPEARLTDGETTGPRTRGIDRVRRHRDRLVERTGIRIQAGVTESREHAITEHLRTHGASFFAPMHEASGGGFPAETVGALWNLVWRGVVTNDTVHALRAFTRSGPNRRRARRRETRAFRSRRLVPPAAEGRWTLVGASTRSGAATLQADSHRSRSPALRVNLTTWAAATAEQLMARHGVLTREALRSESVPGGFSMVYPVLKAMADGGRLRRGYFVAGLGATQFALPGALDLLRSPRERGSEGGDRCEVAFLAATDPANPYGAALKWPAFLADATCSGDDRSRARSISRGPARIVGAGVVLVDGALAAYIARGGGQLLTWLPDCEPGRSTTARLIARALIERARSAAAGTEPSSEIVEGVSTPPRGMLIEEIDGMQPGTHALAPFLVEAGFIAGAMGFQPTFPRWA